MSESVVIVGSLREGNLERSYARGFEACGWTVHAWEPVAAVDRFVRGGRVGRVLNNYMGVEAWTKKANLELLEMVWELTPRVLLVIDTFGVRAGTLAQIRSFPDRPQLFCMFPDSPRNLSGELIQSLPLFDIFFVISPAWVETLQVLGAPDVRYLPLAADTDLHHPGETPVRTDVDLGFIGRWSPERERFLEALADHDLRIWGGTEWKKSVRDGSPLPKKWTGTTVIGRDFADACERTKIMLNLIGADGWPGPNMRSFELPACRVFSLSTRTPSVVELFEEGKTIECFGTLDEARGQIDHYLSDDIARERLALEAHNFVTTGGHTYRDRVEQVIALAGG